MRQIALFLVCALASDMTQWAIMGVSYGLVSMSVGVIAAEMFGGRGNQETP